MKVEELSSYGKAFDHIPLRGQLVQAKVMLSELIKKFGLVGALGFMFKVSKRGKQIKKDHGTTIMESFPGLSSSAYKELYLMGAMYQVLSEIDGKEKAYTFIQGIIRKVGPTVHAILYDINNLKNVRVISTRISASSTVPCLKIARQLGFMNLKLRNRKICNTST